MQISTAVVCLGGMILFCALIAFALYFKADVKAGGKFKGGEFFIEATDKKK